MVFRTICDWFQGYKADIIWVGDETIDSLLLLWWGDINIW